MSAYPRLISRAWSHTPAARGFSLVELIVVIAIVSVLVAMTLPSLKEARVQAQTIQCASNLRQFSLGHLTYAESFGGWFPKGLHASLASIQPDSANTMPKIEGYYGPRVDEYMLCPTYTRKSYNLPQYEPGNGGKGKVYGLGLLTTYRIYTGRGTLINSVNTNYFAFGFYSLSNTAVHNSRGFDKPYVVPAMNLHHSGRWIKNPSGPLTGPSTNARVLHIKKPSVQPMAFDARNQNTPTSRWYAYAAARTFDNMHIDQNGMNTIFLDGHVRWNPQNAKLYDANTLRAVVGYWQGWHYFVP